jgi:hypothetical protein
VSHALLIGLEAIAARRLPKSGAEFTVAWCSGWENWIMNHPRTKHAAVHFPRQRDAAIPARIAEAVDDWIDAQDAGKVDVEQLRGKDLCLIRSLVLAGAPRDELDEAVRRAERRGWGRAPIAVVLGESRP